MFEVTCFDTALGWFNASTPCDGIQHQLAKTFVLPIVVIVAAGRAEAASAILPFDRPGDDIAITVASAQCRHVQDLLEARIVGPETQVVVKFLVHPEWTNPAQNRVVGGTK